ncbi:MAG: multiheme c-type cytochrome, partial [Candidatus Promineifilaceae bacterium]|nr:multiheme c-type cytochrome [Candidatus Promineifilaceae bacterium]
YLLSFSAAVMVGCAGPQGPDGPLGPAGAPGPMGPVGPPGQDATASQEYVGSETCGDCHENQYDSFLLSGHPQGLTQIENSEPPIFANESVTGGVPDPPEGLTWDDVRYVVGGFGWKALFVNNDGYIITGNENATTQYNFAHEALEIPAGWSAFHPGEESVSFDCGRCHTTGYASQGHQNGLEGVVGTWNFDGIQCEACHGPGSRHADDPRGVRMVLDRSSQLCGKCHVRGNLAEVEAEDGFEAHNQQFSDLFNSKHFAISCVTCHDPHASASFADEALNPNKGIRQVCENCHWANEHQNNSKHFSLDCIDCHMPPMSKSAVGDLTRFTADIRSHQFSINPDPEAVQFSEDETGVMPYISLDYACRHCHNGEDYSERTNEELAGVARGYHDPLTPTPEPSPTPEPATEGEATPEASPTP